MEEAKTVGDMLRESGDTFDQRNALYGDNYKRFGPIVDALFPTGVKLYGPDDFRRFGVLVQVISKLSRYCANFAVGGHDDSLLDLCTYSAMLRELDRERAAMTAADLDWLMPRPMAKPSPISLPVESHHKPIKEFTPPFPDVPF
jgi:hypothetical protein